MEAQIGSEADRRADLMLDVVDACCVTHFAAVLLLERVEPCAADIGRRLALNT